MDRQRMLALGWVLVVVVISGCVSAAGELDMDRATDAEIVALANQATECVRENSARTRNLFRGAIENGSATARSYGTLVKSGCPIAHEGRYYEFDATIIDRQAVTNVDFSIDANATVPADETVAFANLSARDRDAFGEAVDPGQGVRAHPGGAYTEAERHRSVLLSGEYSAVRYEGETYAVAVEETESVTVNTWRYDATILANTTAEYASYIRQEHMFALSGLSPGERDVVEEAIADGYTATNESDEAFRSVLERFHRHPSIRERSKRGTWLVRYEGAVYIATLTWDEFVVDDE